MAWVSCSDHYLALTTICYAHDVHEVAKGEADCKSLPIRTSCFELPKYLAKTRAFLDMAIMIMDDHAAIASHDRRLMMFAVFHSSMQCCVYVDSDDKQICFCHK